MAHLIDKSALVEEIEKRIKEIDEIGTYLSPKGVLTNLLCHLDTLEVKEVDLEREIRRYRMNNSIIGHREESLYDYMTNVAKHFFEFGLKIQKLSHEKKKSNAITRLLKLLKSTIMVH